MSPQREELLRFLARAAVTIDRPHPTRVAIDGVDAAGKTILADQLAPYVEDLGRAVIRASVDGFHRPRSDRYRRGPDSAEGFYHDSFDYAALRTYLLDPLGPGGDRSYRTAAFDWRTDAPAIVERTIASESSVLLFDGIFSERPELVDAWDLCIFLDVAFDETLRRSLVRDSSATSSQAEVERRFWARYAPGQKLYLAEARPRDRAHLLVDHNDPANPLLLADRRA